MSLTNNDITVCIIGEAGRGALAGPLCLVGCMFGKPTWHTVWHSAKEIDELGISTCIKHSLEQIKTVLNADRYIYSGNSTFGVSGVEVLDCDTLTSDAVMIGAMAKSSRKRAMQAINTKYPLYDFECNLGYPTVTHIEMIKRYGACEIHRQSFVAKKLR